MNTCVSTNNKSNDTKHDKQAIFNEIHIKFRSFVSVPIGTAINDGRKGNSECRKTHGTKKRDEQAQLWNSHRKQNWKRKK